MKSVLCYPLLGLALLFAASCGQKEEFYIQRVDIPAGTSMEEKIEMSARVLPHPRQRLWWEDEFLGFIHYGPNTYAGSEWGTGFEDAALFHPVNLDTDQWCELMKAAGIRRVIMVVKHHEGYSLWQTRYSDHSVASSGWKNGQGDVLQELARSCKKYGLRLGIYLSPADLYQIERSGGYYGNDSGFTERVIPRPVPDRPFGDGRTFTYELDDYNEYFMNQLFELLTEYGPIHEVWFDGANPKPGTGQTYRREAWFDMIRQLAPDAVIFGGPDVRWAGNEAGLTREAEYSVVPMPRVSVMEDNIAGRDRITGETVRFEYFPAETNTSIRHGWFWRNDYEQQVRSVDNVFDIYERSVGGNSVFLLNIPPNTDGRLSPRDAGVLVELGRLIDEVYGRDLLDGAQSQAREVLDDQMDTWWQAPAKQASIEVTLPGVQTVNRFMIREAIFHRGERIEEHSLEARVDGVWTPVAEGKTVGNRSILRFPAVQADAFRLHIRQARLAPAISHLSAHYYDEPPKAVVISRDEKGLVNIKEGFSFYWRRLEVSDLPQAQTIYYTLDGSEPDRNSLLYDGPFALPLGGHLKARAIVGDRQGPVSEQRIGILRTDWLATDSQGRSDEPLRALNGNRYSWWVTGEAPAGTHSITLDMRREYAISGLTYLPHPVVRVGAAGFIESFEVQVSTDGERWSTVHTGRFGNIRNDPSLRIALFDQPATARYVRLARLVPPGGFTQVGAAEIEILSAEDPVY